MPDTFRKTVLLVEDSPDIRDLLRDILEADAYHVLHAMNGREALELLSSLKELPRVILLDIRMPDMDGHQFREAQLLDARIASIPIVVMTADGNVRAEAHKAGAKGYLKKPFESPDVILQTVRRFF